MTTLREAAQQALEALEYLNVTAEHRVDDRIPDAAIAALRAALAQQEPTVRFKCTVVDDRHPNGVPFEQWVNAPRRPTLREMAEDEPGWRLSCGCSSQHGGIPAEWASTTREGDPATAYGVICERHWHEYEAQHPRREWRGLSAEEFWSLPEARGWFPGDHYRLTKLTRAVESKLKEKNHE
jgi:hypothetical protein